MRYWVGIIQQGGGLERERERERPSTKKFKKIDKKKKKEAYSKTHPIQFALAKQPYPIY